MPSESCAICGEEADADELDPHGHFSSDDDTCAICGDEHFVVGQCRASDYVAGLLVES